VKTQIWTAVCVYVLAAIVKKELALDVRSALFYRFFRPFLREKSPICRRFPQGIPALPPPHWTKQLNLFNT